MATPSSLKTNIKRLPGTKMAWKFIKGFKYASAYDLWVPPGHYYSPIPDQRTAQAATKRQARSKRADLPGIDLHDKEQLRLIKTLQPKMTTIPFPQTRQERYRYFFINDQYPAGDAVTYFALLQHLKPKKIIEVGSGYTTALLLDTQQHFLKYHIDITCIEPYPERLLDQLKDGDLKDISLMQKPVQEVPLKAFKELKKGDILFIDSTHVVKLGSDVEYLIKEVLPILEPGVIVHIHDIHWPFEYPQAWTDEGRFWNEVYMVNAFLAFNQVYKILLWPNYLSKAHPAELKTIPQYKQDIGGSLWLEKVT